MDNAQYYRRLPNSYASRVKALEKAAYRLQPKFREEVSLTASLRNELAFWMEAFVPLIATRKAAHRKLVASRREHKKAVKAMKKSVSGYLQAMQLLIDNDHSPVMERLSYLGLSLNSKSLNIPKKERAISQRVKELIDAEERRRADGCVAIDDCTVQSLYRTLAVYRLSAPLLLNDTVAYSTAHLELKALRKKVDVFIKQLWNHIEFDLSKYTPAMRRAAATDYGVEYVRRRNASESESESEALESESEALESEGEAWALEREERLRRGYGGRGRNERWTGLAVRRLRLWNQKGREP